MQCSAGSSTRLNLAWLASADSFARFPPHCHLLNGCRYLLLRFAAPVLTLQPPVLQNNRKVPDTSYNCRGSLPNLRQPSGINRPKACYLLNFAKKSLLFAGDQFAHDCAHHHPAPAFAFPNASLAPSNTRSTGRFVPVRECFRAKACPGLDPGIPARVKKTRQNKRIEPGSDSIRTDKALE